MSYRDQFSKVIVTADNMDYWQSQTTARLRVGDTMMICHPATEVDLRPFAQLAAYLRCPYPDNAE